MKGYVAKKGNQFYTVIYECLDPTTGKEKRTWHPAGPDRVAAERLARKLAAEAEGANDPTRPCRGLHTVTASRQARLTTWASSVSVGDLGRE